MSQTLAAQTRGFQVASSAVPTHRRWGCYMQTQPMRSVGLATGSRGQHSGPSLHTGSSVSEVGLVAPVTSNSFWNAGRRCSAPHLSLTSVQQGRG
jgi:hypothetical protein